MAKTESPAESLARLLQGTSTEGPDHVPAGCHPKAPSVPEVPSTPAVLEALDACVAAHMPDNATLVEPSVESAMHGVFSEPPEAFATPKAPPERQPDGSGGDSVGQDGAVEAADNAAEASKISFGWQRVVPKAAGGARSHSGAAPSEGLTLPPTVSPTGGVAALEPVNMEDL